MTEINPDLARRRGVPLPDVVVAGTPCQAFSVAGLRKGTADPRGNLTLKFVEIIHELVAARPDGKLAVLWENVPGVLSDTDNAFGAFLGGLVGAMDALPPPEGGSWPGEGMVEGPRARAAWSVLDAQFFGVAQRRRRVFVVLDFGGVLDPAAILLEPDRLRGDTPPRRGARQGPAPVSGAGAKGGRDPEITPDVHVACQTAIGEYVPDDLAGTLAARDYKDATDLVVSFSSKDYGADAMLDLCPTLRAGGHAQSHPNAGVPPAIAFVQNTRNEVRLMGGDGDLEGAIAASPGAKQQTFPASVSPGSSLEYAVRRLMPLECERLQGFPDGHTAVTHRGKPAADGPRYKAIGNSMAVPVIAWIMERMRQSMARP